MRSSTLSVTEDLSSLILLPALSTAWLILSCSSSLEVKPVATQEQALGPVAAQWLGLPARACALCACACACACGACALEAWEACPYYACSAHAHAHAHADLHVCSCDNAQCIYAVVTMCIACMHVRITRSRWCGVGVRTVVLVEVARGGRDGVGGGLQLHGQGRRLLSDALKRRRQRAAGGVANGVANGSARGGGSKWEGVDESGIITRHSHGDRTAGRVLTFGRRSY